MSLVLTTSQITSWIGEFIWPMTRIGVALMVAPIFGGRLVPKRIRLLAALAITVVLLPVIPAGPAVDPLSASALLITLQQVLIGVAMGLMLQMLFSAVVMGGHTIALSMGLGFSSMVDPQNGVQVPVVSQYYVTIATLLFLVMNGHLALIAVLADSFQTMPVSTEGLLKQDFLSIFAWGGRLLAGGVMIAIPAVTALLLTNIAFGVVTRAAPQLNVFGIGFPITLTLGFVVMMVSLPNFIPQFESLVTDMMAVLVSFGQPTP